MLSREVVLDKLKASLISFGVFLVFAMVLAFLIGRYWFPGYLFWLDGGIQGLGLVLVVGFILGPVLALVFAHPDKSRNKLIFNIVVTLLIQVGAMIWGAYQVWNQRPVAVVYGTERFISVAPSIMALQYRTPERLQVYSDDSPPLVYRREPAGEKEQQQLMAMIFRHGFHTESQAWLFQPFKANLGKVFTNQKAFAAYLRANQLSAWTDWVAGQPGNSMEDYSFALFEGRYRNGILIFSRDGDYLGYLALDGGLPDISNKAPGEAQ